MSKLDREAKLQDLADAARSFKCRIPQLKVPAGRLSMSQQKPKVSFCNKSGVMTSQQSRTSSNFVARPYWNDQRSWPKSANKLRDEIKAPNHTFSATHSSRSDRDRLVAPKRQTVTTKRPLNDGASSVASSKPTRNNVVLVPVDQPTKTVYTNRTLINLPDQETINRHEDLELQQSEAIEGTRNDLKVKEFTSPQNENVTKLKISWQEKIILFEKLKKELYDRQKAITNLYASMGVAHQKMSAMGHKMNLPPAKELQIMNITNMTPEQLLQLCANPHSCNMNIVDDVSPSTPIPIDKLNDVTSKLVSTCKQTLVKNKEIIDALEALLSSPENGINFKTIVVKTKEFLAEHEMLSSAFEKTKNNFILEINGLANFKRMSMKEIMTQNIRNEQLTCEISELNSQKDDLRKQLHEAENRRSHHSRSKVAELEKQLREEKCENKIIKDRLARTTGQSKIQTEQVSLVEAALEQARSQCSTLERTVYQLQKENEKLHDDYKVEFAKFTECIRENAAHLEDISEAREKLQIEKEELEKRIDELSSNYNESISNMKKEISRNVAKIIEAEKKYEDEKDERAKLFEKVEALCAQLVESEMRYKDICKQLQEKDLKLSESSGLQQDLDSTKRQLEVANADIEKYRDRFTQQSEAIADIERNLKNSISVEDNLKRDLKIKDGYITELTKKIGVLEDQLQESSNKMNTYEEQLLSLKKHLAQIQEDFGEFENLGELHKIVNDQRTELFDKTRQNDELAEALQMKNLETEQHLEAITEKDYLLDQKNKMIKMLSEKEEEHAHIIKLLKNNLQMRTEADHDLTRQISEKNTEMEILVTNLETNKQKIRQLENSIISLKDQMRKVHVQKRKDQDKIRKLEDKLLEYKTYKENTMNMGPPTDSLDSIIKILEEELKTPLDPRLKDIEKLRDSSKGSIGDHNLRSKMEKKYEKQDTENDFIIYKKEKSPTNNYLIQAYNPFINSNSELRNSGYKMQTGNWALNPETEQKVCEVPQTVTDNVLRSMRTNDDNERTMSMRTRKKEIYLIKNDLPHFFAPTQLREDKKCKMFKIASHRT